METLLPALLRLLGAAEQQCTFVSLVCAQFAHLQPEGDGPRPGQASAAG
jgi:hypothetical protein